MDYNKHKKTGVLKVRENRIFKTNPGMIRNMRISETPFFSSIHSHRNQNIHQTDYHHRQKYRVHHRA